MVCDAVDEGVVEGDERGRACIAIADMTCRCGKLENWACATPRHCDHPTSISELFTRHCKYQASRVSPCIASIFEVAAVCIQGLKSWTHRRHQDRVTGRRD
jgi:hypothetical protein